MSLDSALWKLSAIFLSLQSLKQCKPFMNESPLCALIVDLVNVDEVLLSASPILYSQSHIVSLRNLVSIRSIYRSFRYIDNFRPIEFFDTLDLSTLFDTSILSINRYFAISSAFYAVLILSCIILCLICVVWNSVLSCPFFSLQISA